MINTFCKLMYKVSSLFSADKPEPEHFETELKDFAGMTYMDDILAQETCHFENFASKTKATHSLFLEEHLVEGARI